MDLSLVKGEACRLSLPDVMLTYCEYPRKYSIELNKILDQITNVCFQGNALENAKYRSFGEAREGRQWEGGGGGGAFEKGGGQMGVSE